MKEHFCPAEQSTITYQGKCNWCGESEGSMNLYQAKTEPNTITFHNSNADWVMRITADRRIEVNEDVEVSEAAQKVLDAMQYLLKAQRTWVGSGDLEDSNAYLTTTQRPRVVFPTMLRKMWSGGEVQAWLDENVNHG